MRLLLDSHTLIWAVDDPGRLSANAESALQSKANELLVSAATVWEVAIKSGQGKLSLSLAYQDWMNQAIADLGTSLLPITIEYAAAQGALAPHHRDPFDRLLVAQAQVEKISIVSSDAIFDRYGISRLW